MWRSHERRSYRRVEYRGAMPFDAMTNLDINFRALAGDSHHWLLFLSRCLYFVVGALLLYAAVFMYEGETSRLENKIELFWIEISERALIVGSKTVAFINAVASLDTRVLNRIFGNKLFSLRLVGMSTTLSSSVSLLILAVSDRGSSANVFFYRASLIAGVAGLAICMLSVVVRSTLAVIPTLIPLALTLFFVCARIVSLFSERVASATYASRDHWSVPVNIALLASLLSDIYASVIIRRSIRFLAEATTTRRVWRAILLQVLWASIFVLLPGLVAIMWWWKHPHTAVGETLFLISFLNISTALLSVAFAVSLGLVLAHKLLWPILERLLYPLARWPILRNRKLLVGLSCLCFVQAFHLTSGFIRALLDIAAK
jgi:hypothetical protein